MFLGNTERLLLLVLALFRLTFAITVDDGPGDVLIRLRTQLGVYDLDESGHPRSGIGSFLACAYCVSRLLSLIAIPAYVWPSLIGDLLILWWGLAGSVALLLRWRPLSSYGG